MQAVERGMASARRRFAALLAVLLLALLASGTVGYFIRYATAPSASVSSPVHTTAIAPGSPAGDRWWQDAPGAATTTNPVGDRWWQDAPAAPAAPQPGGSAVADAGRRIDRG